MTITVTKKGVYVGCIVKLIVSIYINTEFQTYRVNIHNEQPIHLNNTKLIINGRYYDYSFLRIG